MSDKVTTLFDILSGTAQKIILILEQSNQSESLVGSSLSLQSAFFGIIEL